MSPAPTLHLAAELAGRVRVAAIHAAPVHVATASPALRAETERLCGELQRDHAGRAPGAVEGTAAARELFREFGIDPTKTRPSSEALLRRVLAGQDLPRISNAVDLSNLLALSFLLPIGLYDAERIDGAVELRLGRADEGYAGIRKDEVHVAGRLVLADRHGAFGNPTSDSLRTSVTPRTRAVWLVLFAPISLPFPRLERHVVAARSALERHLASPQAPTETKAEIVPPDDQ